MDNYKLQIPDGVQDILPSECYNKRELEKRIKQEFLSSCYNEVETPGFEYYDVFSSGIGSVRQEKMLKFFDAHGRILVLRPDITMPIARMAATKLYEDKPLRLCYVGNAYGTDTAYYSSQKEFTQAGVELLGISGPEGDAEVIALAINSLLSAGLTDFQIEIGQVEYFKGLMEEAGMPEADVEKIREYVDQKNILSVETFIKERGIAPQTGEKVIRLTEMYGGREVLEKAKAYSTNPRCMHAVQNLREVLDILADFGLEEYLSIDLGLLQSLDYYSGITFKGISNRIGQSILSGGRYDGVLLEFGKQIPATGFALGIKRTLIALEKQGGLKPLPCVDIVLSCDKKARSKAYRMMRKLQGEGKRVEFTMNLTFDRLERYAKEIGATPVYCREES